jgi:hypothetical protein
MINSNVIYYNFVIINSDLLFAWCCSSLQSDWFVGSHPQSFTSCDSPYPFPVNLDFAIPLETNQAIVDLALLSDNAALYAAV